MNDRRPPSLLFKTLAVTFATVAVLLAGVFVVVTLSVREQVRETVAENLESSQLLFAELEARRQRELLNYAATLAESPTLKAALDTYTVESALAGTDELSDLVSTVARELDKLAAQVDADAVVVVDGRQHVMAAAGTLAGHWTTVDAVPQFPPREDKAGYDGTTQAGGETFRVLGVPLALGPTPIGTLYLATRIDQRYVDTLRDLSRTQIAVLREGVLDESTLPAGLAAELAVRMGGQDVDGRPDGTVLLGGDTFAFRRLLRLGGTEVYALGSVDDAARAATGQLTRRLSIIVVGAALVGLLGSFVLARLITGPINQLSASAGELTDSRTVERRLPRIGSSLELDRLAESFNSLLKSVTAAEAETEAAYAGAIRALAASLDARDTYTAGHSERVSVLSVAVGQELGLPAHDIEVLRLGALLHDIGKIGVPDAILLKPGRLTQAEFEVIKTHPVVGERILRAVPFLAPHLPIVELHHERPDGRGYPRGLRGDEIPVLARIVHVTDAYDAMTSARAYRDALPAAAALEELWRYTGTQFDTGVVAALARVLPSTPLNPHAVPEMRLPTGVLSAFGTREELEVQARG